MNVFVFVLLAILLGIVLPLWIVFHYITRWRAQRTLSRGDETALADLYECARRLETRIATLEQALGDHPRSDQP
jgi:phage shock protein B